MEFPGAIYHVLNRGNYRQDLFETAGAAQAFVDCLWEVCEQTKWKLHAYCLMKNHYHLAIETPNGNLVEGVHWLQSTYGNRFNRFRNEHGRAFQGRYKAILVEPGVRLFNVACYIHLNPVRAGLVDVERLEDFRWSSLKTFLKSKPEARPKALGRCAWLSQLSQTGDSPEGWRQYAQHLVALSTRDDLQKEAEFDSMDQGWVLGSPEYRQELVQTLEEKTLAKDWGGKELAEINEVRWEAQVKQGLRELEKTTADIISTAKAADWKVGLARWMKTTTRVSNRWLTERLNMGAPDGVSRYCTECRDGRRPAAAGYFDRLTTNIRG